MESQLRQSQIRCLLVEPIRPPLRSPSLRGDAEADEEKETTMKAALEFMITLLEAGSGMPNDINVDVLPFVWRYNRREIT